MNVAGTQKQARWDYQFGGLMLAGSCSAMLRKQIEVWIQSGGHAVEMGPEMLYDRVSDSMNRLKVYYLEHPD